MIKVFFRVLVSSWLISQLSKNRLGTERFYLDCRGRGKESLPYAGIARFIIGYPDQVQRVFSQARFGRPPLRTEAIIGYYAAGSNEFTLRYRPKTAPVSMSRFG